MRVSVARALRKLRRAVGLRPLTDLPYLPGSVFAEDLSLLVLRRRRGWLIDVGDSVLHLLH